ncbi:unnamed protein product [Acanthoscelides obtectus]|uniref:Uncharacterized protein n=1 Tax=Acanthoscelides obtectus TaxID=200917 RepID=A0A9P0KKQ9_ACAOB|nr:unnamed protein product [Acanthoscelides obtectus]CAK1654489.1 hypothetical protein AOBTE_LOCUS18639 [Acanthoscelides obtectus]
MVESEKCNTLKMAFDK